MRASDPMRNFFNMDNGFFRALSRVADLMILNILFIICCLPIVTIGAALTGMNYVTLKMAENEEGYVAKGFLKSFRQNFRQATIIWLIMLAIGIVFVLDFLIMRNAAGTAVDILRILILAVAILYLILLIYVFPTLARFDNSIKITMKNAFIMAIADLPRTLVMLVITVGSVILTFFNAYTLWYGLMVWLLLGFALVAFANSYFMKKVFAKYTPKEEEEDVNPDAWTLDETPAEELTETIQTNTH